PGDVRATPECQVRVAVGERERQQQGLQQQGGRPGAALPGKLLNVERVGSGAGSPAGYERQLLRAQRRALDLCAANLRGGLHPGEVLEGEAGVAPPRADASQVDRLAADN